MYNYYSFLKTRDPLILYPPQKEAVSTSNDAVNSVLLKRKAQVARSPALAQGIQAIENEVYRPSLLSFYWLTGGNTQTMIVPIRSML